MNESDSDKIARGVEEGIRRYQRGMIEGYEASHRRGTLVRSIGILIAIVGVLVLALQLAAWLNYFTSSFGFWKLGLIIIGIGVIVYQYGSWKYL